jgi:hypothetical protein
MTTFARLTHPKAHALRPIRVDVKRNCFINYEATTFPNDPRGGCDMYLRRLKAFGHILDSAEPVDGSLAVDVLDENGDIVDTLAISAHGFKYLRRQLKFRRENDAG